MSGNVAEWVSDVYRPIIDSDANDFNYYRGNVFNKKKINKEGKVVFIGSKGDAIKYDTLENGKIIPKNLPGTIKYVPITSEDVALRRNFTKSMNADINDGDINSSRDFGNEKMEQSMYNSPEKPEFIRDSITGITKVAYDTEKRTTLISDNTRVYKGGAWSDREYWLDPAMRRYLPEYMATNYIGFRCVSDKLGPMSSQKRRARNSAR